MYYHHLYFSLSLANHRARQHPEEPSAPYTCTKCSRPRSFNCDYQLQQHFIRAHSTSNTSSGNTPKRQQQRNMDPMLVCPVCKKTCSSVATLSMHVRTHADPSTRSFLCPMCGQTIVASITRICQHMKMHRDGTKANMRK